jgi:hypothetical protein
MAFAYFLQLKAIAPAALLLALRERQVAPDPKTILTIHPARLMRRQKETRRRRES